MEEEENLLLAVENYRQQIKKVEKALEGVTSNSERVELLDLKGNLDELLKLTLESLNRKDETPENLEINSVDDPFSKEYELFKAELAIDLEEKKVDSKNETLDTGSTTDNHLKIKNELDNLIGKKCQAPYANNYGMMEFHNALVVGIEVGDALSLLSHIKVRVLFTNPTERDMVPCPYFLDDKCKFGEDSCNFSHGYITSFEDLREYQEPDFSKLTKGSRVLARVGTSRVWKSAVIEDIPSDEQVIVKQQGTFTPVFIHDVLPLVGRDGDTSPSSCSDGEEQWLSSHQEAMVEKSLSREPASQKLGDWEKFTKGIGSKLMAKMGYVVGTGLGKNCEGRLEPVEALVLPAGKSLDHCMNLKEAAGGSKDLFSAEKLQRKLALKEMRKSKRMYQREKRKEKHDLFKFINSNLSTEDCKPSSSSAKVRSNESLKNKLASTSGRELNVQRLKIAEDVRDAERQIFILSESLARQKSGSISHKNLLARLDSENEKLEKLKKFDKNVEREQSLRETKRKMTVF